MGRERSFEVMNCYLNDVCADRKIELLDQIAAEDMKDWSQTIPGRAGLEYHVRDFWRIFPDVEVKVLRIIADEDQVVGLWRFKGVAVAEYWGIQPNGTPIAVTVSSTFRLADGLIKDYWIIYNALDAITQMGAEIRDPSA
jgi:predicted ester cyclase